MYKELRGIHVRIITDWRPSLDLTATIMLIDEAENNLLLKLENPLSNSNKIYRYVVASPRRECDKVKTLLVSGNLLTGSTWIHDEKFNSKIHWMLVGGEAEWQASRLYV